MPRIRPSHERIESIDSISGFGLFRNFVWDGATLDSFGQLNLIYGWNYSGKTTLSRVFQSVERGSIDHDFSGGSFQFSKGDGTQIDSSLTGNPYQFRVFNRLFVAHNFQQGTDMTNANVIAVLGETNQALKNRLADLENRKSKIENYQIGLGRNKSTILKVIDDGGTAQARVINGIVGGRYDRRHLNGTIASLDQNCWPLPCNQNLEEQKEQFRRASDFLEVDLYKLDHSSIVKTFLRMRGTLREVATNNAIQSLKEDQSLENWVQQGMELNSQDAPCGFCGNNIDEFRWNELQGHFSTAFMNLKAKVVAHKHDVEHCNLNPPLIDEGMLYPDERDGFTNLIIELNQKLSSVLDSKNETLSLLDQKISDLETPLELKLDIDAAKNLRRLINALNKILTSHNERVLAADRVTEEAREAICIHYAVEYLRDCKVLMNREQIEAIEQRISDCGVLIGKIQTQISEVEKEIKDASIAAKRINENLSVLLPGDNIEAVKVNDTDFQFQRNGQVANNMSEGERTAVAFSYFLTKLEEGTTPIEELIIVIDDPISSLDVNHIYAVHSIIENRLSKSRQLFVLTHNSNFFGITKDWMKKRDGRFYMTNRQLDSDGEWYSALVKLPRLLKQFKSDYQYTYYCLKKIDDDPSPQFENLCGVPNMVRRLLEAYLGFIFPEGGGWGEKLSLILPCEETCGKIKKFADENSHAHSLTQATEVPDYVAHCKEIVNEVISALRSHNPDHVASLEAELLR